MIAHVRHYTTKEGGDWLLWPFPEDVKPSNPYLLTHAPGRTAVLPLRGNGGVREFLEVHAIRLDNGRIWDSINGFRDDLGAA